MIIQSVDRAIRLLYAVAERAEGCGVRELARQHGLSPATAQNLLQTLCHHGLVRFDPLSRRYRLGPSAVALGAGYDQVQILHQLVHPHLLAFCRAQGCNGGAAIMHEGDVLVVDAIRGESPQEPLPFRPFIALQAHRMATGQLLLAQLDPAGRQAWFERRAAQPDGEPLVVDRAAFEQTCAAIRERGHSLLEADPELPHPSFALPVRDPEGTVALALGALLHVRDDSPQRRRACLDALTAAAAAIERDWHGRRR